MKKISNNNSDCLDTKRNLLLAKTSDKNIGRVGLSPEGNGGRKVNRRVDGLKVEKAVN